MAGLVLAVAGCATAPVVTDPMAAKVRRLVDDTTHERREAQAFASLEQLGPPAVPYIVGQLGDMRKLPIEQIDLANHAPDAFESIRHYGPQVVHDALAAILNQVTGQHFGFVYNGATDAQRADNRQQWVTWCVATYPAQATTCRGM
ncbi:hypothetical protein KPL74_04370 [Bacillus sp. NP157]|nr:hypothetical protein KPL74_04370 [Bacillus sp. NP157]